MSARLLVLPKFLRSSQARKANFFISARARKKMAVLGMLANARKDHSSPLIQVVTLFAPERCDNFIGALLITFKTCCDR